MNDNNDSGPPPDGEDTTPAAAMAASAAATPPRLMDSIDLDAMYIAQDELGQGDLEEVLTEVPVRKPKAQEWVRTRWDRTTRMYLLKDANDRDRPYFVSPAVQKLIPKEVTVWDLIASVNISGVFFLWMIRPPEASGTPNSWNVSARAAAIAAKDAWVRMSSDQATGRYTVMKATADFGEPKWPTLDFKELLLMAIAPNYIDSADHPIVQRLLGKK